MKKAPLSIDEPIEISEKPLRKKSERIPGEMGEMKVGNLCNTHGNFLDSRGFFSCWFCDPGFCIISIENRSAMFHFLVSLFFRIMHWSSVLMLLSHLDFCQFFLLLFTALPRGRRGFRLFCCILP